MSKHTPGPWIAVGGYVETPVDEYADICSCHPADFGQRSLQRDESEMHANARLIAAAPELLDVVLAWLPMMESLADSGIGPVGLDRARAAIAKATGKQT